MKRTALALMMALLFSAVAGTQFVNLGTTNPVLPVYLPKITIGSDGSVTPETQYINRTGSVYTLTADIIEEYSIYILCSNIVFDGAGYSINVTTADNLGLNLRRVSNVTVKNVEVFSRHNAIIFNYCYYCLVTGIKSSNKYIHFNDCNFNTISESNTKISLLESKNNLVLRNNITGLSVFYSFSNNFSQNNILCYAPTPRNSTDYWDNGSVGNYWKDYWIKCHNASEIGNTGIGDKPYVIDADNVDHYPLMYPFKIEKGTIAFPKQEAEPEPFPTTLVVASVAAAVVVGVVLLVYFKKRKH